MHNTNGAYLIRVLFVPNLHRHAFKQIHPTKHHDPKCQLRKAEAGWTGNKGEVVS